VGEVLGSREDDRVDAGFFFGEVFGMISLIEMMVFKEMMFLDGLMLFDAARWCDITRRTVRC
jgi:hypothetical protein